MAVTHVNRSRLAAAIELMAEFARRTGLTSQRPQRRYLWTDAFAVCNGIALTHATGDPGHGELALRLVERVHAVLGRHRHDDPRTGWISGLDDAAGRAHPTRGGLRIGKPLPERRRDEPYDERLEWDRDGQYFHYLTKWMLALDRVARWKRDPLMSVWARELAVVAHSGFVRGRRMIWKASIDLTWPQVASMGQHDPLDGYLTFAQLDAGARAVGAHEGPAVGVLAAELGGMVDRERLATTDPLALGGLLVDAQRVAALATRNELAPNGLLDALLEAALLGLRAYVDRSDLYLPASRRLAFRELGLAIGLAAAARIPEPAAPDALGRLQRYARLRSEIESFWLEPAHRPVRPWLDHADINDVMLATCVLPDGILEA